MPLIVTEELSYQLATQFYPHIAIEYFPDLELQLGQIANRFDTLFECKYWKVHLKKLFFDFYQKEMELIFCPHGQSEKGYGSPLLQPYALQDKVLIYGRLMKEMLEEMQISLPPFETIGNYRYRFYQTHQSFYDELAKRVLPLDFSKKTLLYAPTWLDLERSTSFFTFGTKVAADLPSDWNLIVKLHPLLRQKDPALFFSLSHLFENRANMICLDEFPPVYPVLALSDAYLGDSSSIGYDYLAFERPMFFFPSPPQRIHQAGRIIDPDQNIFLQVEKPNLFQKEQKLLYQHAFTL